jgi:hypothetical protein
VQMLHFQTEKKGPYYQGIFELFIDFKLIILNALYYLQNIVSFTKIMITVLTHFNHICHERKIIYIFINE